MRLRRLYLSPLGRLISIILNSLSFIHRPFMVYGKRDPASGAFRKHTRFSSSAAINDWGGISLGDNVWIGHRCIVDGSGGLVLEEGVQLAAGAMIFSHGSQDSIRLCGAKFIEIDAVERTGYTRKNVVIGRYSFIGAGSIILPGSELGMGCLVGAGCVVSGRFPDFSVLVGSPARVIGDSRDRDRQFFDSEFVRQNYFDRYTMESFCRKSE